MSLLGRNFPLILWKYSSLNNNFLIRQLTSLHNNNLSSPLFVILVIFLFSCNERLKHLQLFGLEKTGIRLTSSICINASGESAKMEPVAPSDRTRGSKHSLIHRRILLADFFFLLRVTEYWNRLSKETAVFQSLDVLNKPPVHSYEQPAVG